MNRGVEKRDIFLKNQDYSRFILALELFNTRSEINIWQLIARAGTVPARTRLEAQRNQKHEAIVELMAFTLMPNHYHLIVREIVEGGIGLFMKKLGGYSTYFNKQYNRVGSLLQSRYKAVKITNDAQLTNTFCYVHTNPVGLWERGWKNFTVANSPAAINKLQHYRWSSYNDYIGVPQFPALTRREFFIQRFGNPETCKQFIEDWVAFKAKTIELDPKIINFC